uniref:Retrovirus-related Pol polyprotein from type-1 retrotransposable element R1 n=1 Tax=Schizaphis graminum TaxID=13262 RepID=A0A2S2P1H1_SCHGA
MEICIVLYNMDFNMIEKWKNEWAAPKLDEQNYLKEPTAKPPGHNLPRKEWTTLNRIRTRHGRCGYLQMYKWNAVPSPNCECGNPYQTISHILNECTIRKFNGEPEDVFNASPEAIEWIQNLDIKL